jgi:HEAT repeat protein
MFDLLCNFGQPAVSEAQKRLRDPRPYYVRNLVMLIRWAGSPAAAPFLKPLLRHPDPKVRMEAIAALLRFKDPEAVPLLREALRSKDPDVASQAVFIAGQYRVTDVTEDLVSMFKKVILFESDYTVNEEIIKALGEIGDPVVIPELEKFARASWTLYPERFSHMKASLFESLSRYPKESIAGLLKTGERMNDDRIKRICRKLVERK